MMAGFRCVLFALALVLQYGSFTLAADITPFSPLCDTIKENALLTLGSECWDSKNPSFDAQRKLKEHYFIKYVVESSGADAGIPIGQVYFASRRDFLDGQPPAPWKKVTGWAEVGDMVISRTGMGIIVKLGGAPALLSDGKPVTKRRTPSALWSELDGAAQGLWGTCQDQVAGTFLDPTQPPSPCLPWAQSQALLERYNSVNPRIFLVLQTHSRIGQYLEDVRVFSTRSIIAVLRPVAAAPPPAPEHYPPIWTIDCGIFGTFLRLRESMPLPQCPPAQEPTLTLFNSNTHQNGVEITLDGALSTAYDPLLRTIFVMHGFQASGESDWVVELRQALLTANNDNVIVVDWEEGADITYRRLNIHSQAAANTQTMAALVAMIIEKLTDESGTLPSRVWCMGHSLGAHICGRTGMVVQDLIGAKIARVTGFDPAGPLFNDLLFTYGVNPESATFVDVIHTNVQLFGTIHPRGHMDFYPNDGKVQPMCRRRFGLTCSHGASYQYFTVSITQNCFAALEGCATAGDRWRTCTASEVPLAYMGYHALGSGPNGIYRLDVTANHPFCVGPEGGTTTTSSTTPSSTPGSSNTPASTPSSSSTSALTPSTTPSTTPTPGFVSKCMCFTGTNVNIRDTACGSTILGQENTGSCYQTVSNPQDCTLSGTQETFYELDYQTGGWAAGTFLQESAMTKCLPCVCLTGTNVNVRDSACGSTILGQVNTGSCYRVISEAEQTCTLGGSTVNFVKLDHLGGGWVTTTYLQTATSGECP